MARVTVEDCLEVVENRFELVVIASQRAKLLASGAQLTVSRDNDKNPVVALREIAERNVNVPILREMVIKNLQREGKFDSKEEETDLDSDVVEHDEMGMMEEIDALGVDNMDFDLDDMSFEDDTNLDLEE